MTTKNQVSELLERVSDLERIVTLLEEWIDALPAHTGFYKPEGLWKKNE
jgi:hypothetical protein